MESIRNYFINKIESSARNANGTHAVLQLGIEQYEKQTSNHQTATVFIGAGPPGDPNTRIGKYTPTHQEIRTKLQNNNNIIFELYLTEIIQYWFDFLAELYSFVINQNLNGSATFDIPKSKINIDFTKSNSDLIAWVRKQSKNEFDFKSADEKLKIIKKITSADFNSISLDLSILKTNIQVRNILQHNNGEITQKDLKYLGRQNIEQDEGNKITYVSGGDKVSRTPFDIENLVISMKRIANQLVPVF